ncbi:MAG: FTR1 family protein [Lysobacteraceae bacterium]
MITTRIRVCALLALLALPLMAWAQGPVSDITTVVQQTWKLLDYVATDYPGAVNAGVVVHEAEYLEQQEFSATVAAQLERLPDAEHLAALREQAQGLMRAVNDRVSAEEVAQRAHALGADLLAAYPVPSAPERAPDLARGAALYQQQCVSCHGASGAGDGPAAAALDPPPIDFTDAARADLRSPLSLYQATAQGIEGTGMVGYSGALSDEDLWALAYYVGTLAYGPQAGQGKAAWRDQPQLRAHVSSLEELSQARAGQLASTFDLTTARGVLGWLRQNPAAVLEAPAGLALARAKLAASLAAHQAGRSDEARHLALSSYLDGVEPDEARLNTRDRALRGRIEAAMGAYRSALSGRDGDAAALAAAADALLVEAQSVLEAGSSSPGTAFIGSFTILLREGLEALLVVIALLAFLRKSGRSELVRHVHAGWTLALVAGGVTWVVATYFITISGASREVTEGLAALFAAVVLLSVGLWMHQKSIGGRWQQYLKVKMSAALKRRSAFFLFVLAFVSVYREVFETILFYAALWADGHHPWMVAGMVAAVGVLAVIAWLMLRTSRRLPLGAFFSASSILIAVLAVVLTGKGVAALQEAGWFSLSPAPLPSIDWLGIHPTWESALAQLLMVVALLAGFAYNRVQARQHLAVETH